MADDITEFLRRAAQRRAQQLKQQRAAGQRTAKGTAQTVSTEVVVAEVVAKPLAKAAFSKIEQEVSRDLDTSAFGRRAESMGEVTEQADERMGAVLHAKFDHKLGSIAPPTEAVSGEIMAGTETRVAANHPLLELLRNAQSLRSAIILGELLRRPEERW